MDAPRPTKDFAKALRRSMSLPEVLLWRQLKGRRLGGLQFRRQHPIGRYILDFYCDAVKLAVEVDGAGHDCRLDEDDIRDAWPVRQGVRTFRIPASAVLAEPEIAAQSILAFLDAPP